MRWCRFQAKGAPSFGIIEGDAIVPVSGSPFAEYRRSRSKVPLKDAKLLAPVVPKPIFYATSRNYRTSLLDNIVRTRRVFQTMEPWTGYRAATAITGPDSDVVIPADCPPDDVTFQGEIVVVIGKKGRLLSNEEAQDAIFGYMIGNDVTANTWAETDTRQWRGKNCDTFKPLGPWIETDLDVDQAVCTIRYNGRETAEWKVNAWFYSPADVLVAITKYMTVKPGDILMMGTDGVRSPYVRTGDVVEIEVSGIGVLRNRFIQSVDWH
jgi:2-keto-4-pentenoate hydratase/2-oxohepta-3-ene-1,7-dioic acid hydratase in catechol pathway